MCVCVCVFIRTNNENLQIDFSNIFEGHVNRFLNFHFHDISALSYFSIQIHLSLLFFTSFFSRLFHFPLPLYLISVCCQQLSSFLSLLYSISLSPASQFSFLFFFFLVYPQYGSCTFSTLSRDILMLLLSIAFYSYSCISLLLSTFFLPFYYSYFVTLLFSSSSS